MNSFYQYLILLLLLPSSVLAVQEIPATPIEITTDSEAIKESEDDNDDEEDDDSEEEEDDSEDNEDNDTEIDNNNQQEDNNTEEDEQEESNNATNNNNSADDDTEKKPFIETSASIDFSYSVPIDNDDAEKESDLSGSLNISLHPSDNLSFHTSIGKRRETELEVDEAYVDWSVRDDQTVSLRAGKKFAPFGQFSSTMINSSLPTQLGETDPDALIEGALELNQTTVQAYIFKGQSAQIDSNEKHELAYGAAVNYETDSANVGVGYLSNLAESDFFSANDVARKIPAAVIHAEVNVGRFTIIGEHLAATKDFAEDDLDETITEAAKPSASQLEVNFTFENQGTLGLAWNNTKEAEEIDLPKETIGIAYSYPIREDLTATIELSQSKDYDDTKSKEVIVELSKEFY